MKEAGESVYEESIIPMGTAYGIKFSDGKVYFCRVNTTDPDIFTCEFPHSGSRYTMKKEGKLWKVFSTTTGTYGKGHVLLNIYRLSARRMFFDDGSHVFPEGETMPTDN